MPDESLALHARWWQLETCGSEAAPGDSWRQELAEEKINRSYAELADRNEGMIGALTETSAKARACPF